MTPAFMGNALLRALRPSDFKILNAALTPIALEKAHTVFNPGEPASHVWFPKTGMISIVALDGKGTAIEVATVGHEGMTGFATVMGGENVSLRGDGPSPGERLGETPSHSLRSIWR